MLLHGYVLHGYEDSKNDSIISLKGLLDVWLTYNGLNSVMKLKWNQSKEDIWTS